MPTEDFEQAQNLSSQVEQARQRAVLAASDAGAARDDAWNALHAAREHANATSQVVDGAERARDEAQAAADRAEAPTDSMVATLAGNPVSLTRAAVDQATGDMITTEGSTTQAAGDARWLKRDGADIAVASEIERTGSEIQVSGDARWVTQTGADILVAAEIERTGSETQVSGDNRWVTNEGADTTVSALLGTDGSETQAAGDGRYLREQTADSRYMRTIMQAGTPEVTMGAMWLNTITGKMHYPVSLGEMAKTNLATNPKMVSRNSRYVIPGSTGWQVASFNMRSSAFDDTAPYPWTTRCPQMAQDIISMGSSMVALQEIGNIGSGPSMADDLVVALNSATAPGTWATKYGTRQNGFVYKTAVWSMGAVTTEGINVNYPDDVTGRSVVYGAAVHAPSNATVLMASVHLRSSGSNLALGQTEGARMAGEIVMKARHDLGDIPVILAGDFNDASTVKPAPLGVLRDDFGMEITHYAVAPTNPTLNTFNNFDPAMSGKQGGVWIDAILSIGVSAVSSGTYARFASGSALPLATPMASDHQPVYATFGSVYAPGIRRVGKLDTPMTNGGNAVVRQWVDPSTKETWCVVQPDSGATTSSAAYPASQSTASQELGWEPGKYYAVAADCRLDKPQTGSLGSVARRIDIGTTIGGVDNFFYARSAQATNAIGITRLGVSFQYPIDATNVFIRLGNGSTSQTDIVKWGRIAICEGTTAAEALENAMTYFDGDTPGCQWSGEPEASRSVYSGPSWVPVGG